MSTLSERRFRIFGSSLLWRRSPKRWYDAMQRSDQNELGRTRSRSLGSSEGRQPRARLCLALVSRQSDQRLGERAPPSAKVVPAAELPVVDLIALRLKYRA